jgi:ABC-type dipeptide/oligopeptide/nickel transport system permease component
MFKYVSKRLALMLCTFFIIFTMCFVLIKLLPIPANVLPGMDPEIAYRTLEGRGWITNIREGANGVWEYDRVPILIQYANYLKRIVVDGDFGIATTLPGYATKDLWTEVFIPKLPPTILINIYSTLIGVPIGLGLGIWAALKKNKWQDQVINIFIILLISLPSIVLALLIKLFCFKFQLPMEMLTSNAYFTWPVFKSMLPAVFALCLGSIAGYARYTRAELSEVLTSEFMLLARTKGLTKGQAIYRHAMRNSMVVIFPSILGEFISVLSGSLIIEKMFLINGVGGLYLSAINNTDYDAFMLLSGFYTLISLAAGIVIDISYGIIDPRIRMGAK